MRKKQKRIVLLLFLCMLTAGLSIACSKQNANQNNNNQNGKTNNMDSSNNSSNDNLSGTITLAGSTSMEKLANAAAEAFMNKYKNVTVSAEFIDSSAGIEAVLKGTVDIGNSSRDLKDSEKAAGAVENIVALDGIAVIIDHSNAVSNLTKEQLMKIYTGEVNNWNAIGGPDLPIVSIGREAGSGTRGAFEELIGIGEDAVYANEINSTGGVMAKVASTPGAVGYVSLDVLNDTVATVNVDGVAPTEENIKAGKYLLSRPFVMATVGDLSKQSKNVQAFFDYLKSEEGKKIIKSVGLITID